MSASGYTPIQLYRTTTAAAVPTAGNLSAGELAINLTDEKLYFKNAGGTVKLLAYTGSVAATVSSVNASGGTTGLTFSGGPITTSGTLTLAGTLAAANGGTGQSSYTVGDILYASTTSALSKLADVATGNALISGGVGVAPAWGKIGLTTHVSGTLAVGNGGTGATTLTANGVLLGNGTSAFSATAAGTTGQVLVGNTGTAPTWATLTSTAVTSISFGTTGLTPSTATQGAVTVAGTLAAANGGTGQSSYAVGDILYASTTSALSKLADVATGNALISGGVGVAPSWGKIGLTTHVSGTLAIANGGTGATTLTGVVIGNGTSAFTTVTAPSGAIVGTTDTQNLTNKTLTTGNTLDAGTSVSDTGTIAANSPGFRGMPQNSQTASYTLALTDAGKHISITTGGVVVPANGTVAFPVGTAIVIYNNSASSQNISITTDTMYLAGTATTGTRALAQRGLATLVKVGTTTWVISGSGVT